jgi:ABC-2 type transport system permease protein
MPRDASSTDTTEHGTAQPRTGAIHDIGYQHYNGPRLRRPALVRALYQDTLRGCVGLGRPVGTKLTTAFLATAMILPALVIGITVNVTHLRHLPIEYTEYVLPMQLVLSTYLAIQAPVVLSRDLRFRTVTLYFSRPLRRGDYVIAKYLALVTAVFAMIAIPLTVLYLTALLAKIPWWSQTQELLQGLAGAALFALVLSGLALVIASVTPRRGFGIAAIITTLLLLMTITGIAQGVAHYLGHQTAAGYLGMLAPFTLVDGVQVWLLGAGSGAIAGPPGTLGGPVFALGTLVMISGSLALLHLRYRKVSLA